MSHKERPSVSEPLSRREFLKRTAAATLGVSAMSILPAAQALAATASGSPGKAEQFASPPMAEPVEIQYWDMVWGPPEYVDTGKKLAEMFNAEHPDIKVVYQSTPWANFFQTFVTAIGAGVAPDISTGAAYQAAYFYNQGAILPVNDVVEDMKAAGKLDDLVPGAVERLKFGEDYVAFPWAIDIRVIWYRKDLLEEAGVEAPTNWDQFKTVAQALTKGDTYAYVMLGTMEPGGHQNLWFWMFDNGGGWFTPDRKVDVFYERNVEALEFFSDLVKSGVVHPGSIGYDVSEGRRALAQGRAAIFVLNPGEPEMAPESGEKLLLGSPLVGPHGDKGTISWINNRMIYKQSKHPDAAKVVMKWWFDNELLMWTEGHCGQLTTRKSFGANDYFQSKPHIAKIIAEWLPIGKSAGERVPGIFPELHIIEGEGFMDTLFGDLLQGKDVNESLQKVETVLNVILK